MLASTVIFIHSIPTKTCDKQLPKPMLILLSDAYDCICYAPITPVRALVPILDFVQIVR